MKPSHIPLIAAGLLLAASGNAQIPQIINYQGRVAASGVNFEGTGLFKFALVNGAGTISFWSNDGSSVSGSEPATAVSLAVSKGLFSVLLGDTTQPNMSAIPASVFSNSDVRVRVWFNDGVRGTQLLTPDQRIGAVGYAMMAAGVPDGAITSAKLAPGAAAANLNAGGQSGVASGGLLLSLRENPALVSAGYILLGKVIVGAADNWQRHNSTGTPPTGRFLHTAIWTGSEMIIWGGDRDGPLNSGGRYDPVAKTWRSVSLTGAPSARIEHTAVWTGAEMIIWGGLNANIRLNTGARYDPQTDTWRAVSTVGAPSGRNLHTAIWTGSEMIVWGGFTGVVSLNTGARYNPVTDTWRPVTQNSAPLGRAGHQAVWTGSDMIIEGGDVTAGGKVYNPVTDAWGADASGGQRTGTIAVWTGGARAVWGGLGSGGVRLNTGYFGGTPLGTFPTATDIGSYNGARYAHTTVWTGRELVVWGGSGMGGFQPQNKADGGTYDPETREWTAIRSSTQTPAARRLHTAVWTGLEMLVWGGESNGQYFEEVTAFYPPGREMYLYQRP